MVAKVDRMGLVVRMLCQCVAGKSQKTSSFSLSFCRRRGALEYFG